MEKRGKFWATEVSYCDLAHFIPG